MIGDPSGRSDERNFLTEEKLRHNEQCIYDQLKIFLENIKKKLWTAMIFWIRRYTYKYSRKYEKDLQEFFINSTDFVGSERNFRLLQKAYMAVRGHTIDTTLLLFEILKQAPEDIKSPDIQTYLQQKLWNDFSLWTLYSQDNVLDGKWREEEWCWKNIDSKWNSILQDTINRTTIRDEYIVNDKEKRISIIDRENPDIYKDRSWTQYKIYLDAPIGIWLFHNNKPIALISFSLQDSTTLFIRQLQNVTVEYFDRYGRIIEKKTDITAQTIPRQETLYDIVNLLAKKYQCKKIVIQSGENNPWLHIKRLELQYNEDEERLKEVEIDQPHLSLDIAKKIYDTFAEKEGFKKNKKTKNRDKKI